ncbi:hypothetical protein BM1_07244 [Bipolaris maydis]|nr:hypothetical protein BM1_07244 [Bipolaris maydis]
MLVLSISIAESSAPTDADSPLSTPVHAHTSAVMATATATAMAALTFGRVADAAQALPQPWFAPMRFLRPASSRPSTHMYILHALITRLLFRVSPSTPYGPLTPSPAHQIRHSNPALADMSSTRSSSPPTIPAHYTTAVPSPARFCWEHTSSQPSGSIAT